jgi:hypothetical protein
MEELSAEVRALRAGEKPRAGVDTLTDDDVLVLGDTLLGVSEIPRFLHAAIPHIFLRYRASRYLSARIDAETSGHAEMHHQHLAIVEPRQQILGAPVERIDLSPLQALSEVLRQRKAQVMAPLLDARKAVADQDRRKA